MILFDVSGEVIAWQLHCDGSQTRNRKRSNFWKVLKVRLLFHPRLRVTTPSCLDIFPHARMKVSLSTLAIAATTVQADWAGNLNYRSPSSSHGFLGISMPKVMKRQAGPSYMDAGMLNFTHGVASGDPYPESVILWTRASPDLDNDKSNVTVEGTVPLYNHDTKQYVRASSNPVCVNYAVATDEELSEVVTEGKAYTSSDIDYTIKVEAGGLKPFTQYYYQFTVCGSENKSPVGRTKTAPEHDDDVTGVGLAVYSCSNFPTGFFNAYGNAARKDNIDYVIHVRCLECARISIPTDNSSSAITSTSMRRAPNHDLFSRSERS